MSRKCGANVALCANVFCVCACVRACVRMCVFACVRAFVFGRHESQGALQGVGQVEALSGKARGEEGRKDDGSHIKA